MNDPKPDAEQQQKPAPPPDVNESDSQALSEQVQEEAARDRKQQGGYQ